MAKANTRGKDITFDLDPRKVLIMNGEPPSALISTLIQKNADHIIHRKRTDFAFCADRIKAFENLKGQSLEEMDRILLDEPGDSIDFPFHGRAGKENAVSNLIRYAQGHSRLAPRLQQIQSAAQELALNAAISAASAFKELFKTDFVYSDAPPCRLRLRINEKSVVVSCWDPLGSLTRKNLLDRLLAAFSGPVDIPRTRDIMQSGVGCRIIFDNSTDFAAAVRPGKETMVACRIPLTGSWRSHGTSPKCVHLIGLSET